MRPKYRVRVAVVIDFNVDATSASNACNTAIAIARETCGAKGLPFVKADVLDVERTYPPEDRESMQDCMGAATGAVVTIEEIGA